MVKKYKAGRQSYQRETIQVRIDIGLHRIVKITASKTRETIRQLVEHYIYEGLERDKVSFD